MNAIEERLEQLQTITLGKGSHGSFEKGVCALEAVAWLAGEKHSDKPSCACSVIAAVVRQWNDQLPDDESRNRLIRPLLAKIVGTRIFGDVKQNDVVMMKRMWLVQDWNMRVRTPAFLRLAKLEENAQALAELPEVVDLASLTACTDVVTAAYSAARSAADSAAYSAARSAAYSAAYSLFADTVAELQASFVQLIERMCLVTR